MHSFDIDENSRPYLLNVGAVVVEMVGQGFSPCVVLGVNNGILTMCPRDYVESYNWHVAEWVPFDPQYTIHRERPDSEPAAEFTRPCYHHDPIDNGTRVSECRNCRQRMEFRDWEWSVT